MELKSLFWNSHTKTATLQQPLCTRMNFWRYSIFNLFFGEYFSVEFVLILPPRSDPVPPLLSTLHNATGFLRSKQTKPQGHIKYFQYKFQFSNQNIDDIFHLNYCLSKYLFADVGSPWIPSMQHCLRLPSRDVICQIDVRTCVRAKWSRHDVSADSARVRGDVTLQVGTWRLWRHHSGRSIYR